MRAGIDNSALVQALNLCLIKFEYGLEDMFRVFAPQRRTLRILDLRFRKLDRVADERRDRAGRMRQIDLQFSMDHLRMSKHLVKPVDRRARNSDWLKCRYPVVCRLHCHMHSQKWNKLVAIVKPIGVREKADVGGQFRQSRCCTEFPELLIVSDGQHK